MKKILLTFTILGFLNAETLIHTSIYIDGVSDKARKMPPLLSVMMVGLNKLPMAFLTQMVTTIMI